MSFDFSEIEIRIPNSTGHLQTSFKCCAPDDRNDWFKLDQSFSGGGNSNHPLQYANALALLGKSEREQHWMRFSVCMLEDC